MPHQHHLTDEMRACINECNSCYSICIETLQHCTLMGGRHVAAEHLRALMDCADVCQTSARFMLRGSEFHHNTCGVCADVCRHCAESCEQVDRSDETMRRCAEQCRRCAESCQRMSGGGTRRAGG